MGGRHRGVFGESRGYHRNQALQVSFGTFVLDRGTRQLLRDGQERRIGPKAFELLLSQRPNVVTKERIRDRIWPDTFVAGSTLATVVAELREALDEDPKQPLCLRTVHGVVCGEARDSGPSGSVGPGLTAAYRLVLGDREVAQRQGENVLGRVEEGTAWIESPTVSRRHARVLIEGGQAILEAHRERARGSLYHGRVRTGLVIENLDRKRLVLVIDTAAAGMKSYEKFPIEPSPGSRSTSKPTTGSNPA